MKKLQGVYTALITPFKNGEVDVEGLKTLLSRQMKSGVDGLVVLGSTGESATLQEDEKKSIIKLSRQIVKNKPLVVGAGTNCTKNTIEFCKAAEDLGADILMVSPPYYNKPTQRGLILHFEEILKSIKCPLLIYNNPSRTAVNLEPHTLKELAQNPQLWGVKEACGNLDQMQTIIEMVGHSRPDFSVLSGDDNLTFSLMALGGDGIISVLSNLIPQSIKTFVDHLQKQHYVKARELHYQLTPLFKALFIESNPIPIKTAMNLFNLPSGELRLPLCEMRAENIPLLKKLLENCRDLQ